MEEEDNFTEEKEKSISACLGNREKTKEHGW